MLGATSRVMVLPAPTSEFSPMVTPHTMVALAPMLAPRLTSVGTTCQSSAANSSPASPVARGLRSLVKHTWGPMKAPSSIRTPAPQEAAVLRLPPGIDDDGLALSDAVVVPTPHFRLDGFSDSGHVLEVVVVLLRFIGTELSKHSDRRGRSVEDVDPQPLGDPPGAAGIRVGGDALVHDAGGRQRKRTVDDVRVARDPPDVGEAPVGVLRMDVLVVLRGAGDI